MVDGLVEARFDVSHAEDLKERDEDGRALGAGDGAGTGAEGDELGAAFEGGFGSVDEVEGDFDGEEGADGIEFCGHDCGFCGEFCGWCFEGH